MSLIKRCSCLILLVLTACENKLNSAEPTTVKAQEKKVEEKSSEYTQVALLSLLQTNDELSDHKNNVVTLKGTGTNSSYKIIYKFNTAGNTSFKVIEQTLKSSSTGCSAPDLEMWLKGQNSSRQISIIDQVNVDPNTDYTLEVIAINHSCKALELSLNIVAWTRSPLIDPKIASLYESQQLGQTTFVMNVNFMTAFSSVVGKEKFLSIDSFCSEEFKGSVNTECSRRLDPLSPGESLSEMTITCVAEKNSEKRSYLAVFNSTNKTVSVSCKANETETFVGIFNACHSALVDYKKFGAF